MAKIAIIGAGLGGLSAASRLVGLGHQVEIFERESNSGGRARRVEVDTVNGKYLTEIGPTVFTMIDVANIPFDELDMKLRDKVEMLEVDPGYRGVFSDGSILDWSNDSTKRGKIIADFAGHDQAQGFENYVVWLEKLVKAEYDNFVARNFDHMTDMLKTPGALLKLLKLGAFSKMDKKVSEFISDPRLISMSTFQALYAGVTPAQALAVYCIISYMDLVQGVYYPKGGMSAYGEALTNALIDSGVEVHYNSKVTSLKRLSSSKLEVVANGQASIFDSVISNADLPYSYPEIFGLQMPRKVKSAKYSPSCLIYVVGGASNEQNNRAHHTIHFSNDDTKSYEQLVDSRTMMTDPSFLISNPNVTDPSICPDGTNVYYVLEPCPHLDSQVDFANQREYHLDRMRGHLTKAGIVFDRVDCEHYIDPRDWENQGMYRGTPFSLAHTFFQSGPFRAKNIVKEIPGLFLTGTGTTPGVGIPMVIESGRLSAERVNSYLSNVGVS